MQKDKELFDSMRNIVILNSLHFSYPLPILMRVSYNTLIVKQNTSDYYKYTENIEENKLVLSLSYQDERKRISPNLEKTNKLPIFVPHWFATPLRGKQLKGNQV